MVFTRVDLAFINFCDADFRGADLRVTQMRSVEAQRTNFSGADLRGGSLSYSDISGARFNEASLQQIALVGSKMEGVDLTNANLSWANLNGIKEWKKIRSIQGANIFEVKFAPQGFRAWALDNGAVDLPPVQWRRLHGKQKFHKIIEKRGYYFKQAPGVL